MVVVLRWIKRLRDSRRLRLRAYKKGPLSRDEALCCPHRSEGDNRKKGGGHPLTHARGPAEELQGKCWQQSQLQQDFQKPPLPLPASLHPCWSRRKSSALQIITKTLPASDLECKFFLTGPQAQSGVFSLVSHGTPSHKLPEAEMHEFNHGSRA